MTTVNAPRRPFCCRVNTDLHTPGGWDLSMPSDTAFERLGALCAEHRASRLIFHRAATRVTSPLYRQAALHRASGSGDA